MEWWFVMCITSHADFERDISFLVLEPGSVASVYYDADPQNLFCFPSWEAAQAFCDEEYDPDELPFLHYCVHRLDKYSPVAMLLSGHYSIDRFGCFVPDEYVRKGNYVPNEETIQFLYGFQNQIYDRLNTAQFPSKFADALRLSDC